MEVEAQIDTRPLSSGSMPSPKNLWFTCYEVDFVKVTIYDFEFSFYRWATSIPRYET